MKQEIDNNAMWAAFRQELVLHGELQVVAAIDNALNNLGFTIEETSTIIPVPLKQGEHANFLNKIQIGDKVTRNEDGVLVNLSQLNRVAKKDEKQGGQKPTDKVEPMFREGDWVVYCNDDVDLITGIEENGYCINNGGYIPFVCASDIRLWTIQDAKDGDVISWDDSKCIAIFKNIYDEDSFNSYGFVGGCTGTFESRMSYHDIEGAHPATKEQRDTLIKAMADAGYAFDFEKKELKKIEQKPVWSQDVQEEPVSEDLGDYINELSKQFPEVSFAKLSRIAVRAAKWQIEQINEVLLSEVLPCFMHGGEADEVLAKLEEVLNKK